MTREIEYEAWDRTNNIMLTSEDQQYVGQCFKWIAEGQDLILRQWTGLHDSAGVKIFEGDLFYYACPSDNLERLCKIGYCNDKMGFEVYQICEGEEDPLFYFVDGWETYETPKYLKIIKIIGNIYENPKLLTNNK